MRQFGLLVLIIVAAGVVKLLVTADRVSHFQKVAGHAEGQSGIVKNEKPEPDVEVLRWVRENVKSDDEEFQISGCATNGRRIFESTVGPIDEDAIPVITMACIAYSQAWGLARGDETLLDELGASADAVHRREADIRMKAWRELPADVRDAAANLEPKNESLHEWCRELGFRAASDNMDQVGEATIRQVLTAYRQCHRRALYAAAREDSRLSGVFSVSEARRREEELHKAKQRDLDFYESNQRWLEELSGGRR